VFPETRYAKKDGVHIAYQVVGEGDLDLLLVSAWFSYLEARWEIPGFAHYLRRLSSFSRVISFDKHGIGLSDPIPLDRLPPLEEWMDDVRAVLDAIGCHRAAVMGANEGSLMAALFAASYPERVTALVIANPMARPAWAPDHPWGFAVGNVDVVIDEVEEFLTGTRHHLAGDRVLSTILFTDIVESTARAVELGDSRWRELLEAHEVIAEREVASFGGIVADFAGDGLLASFDGPARAVRCAFALRHDLRKLGLEMRAGPSHRRGRAPWRPRGGNRRPHRLAHHFPRGAGRGARFSHGERSCCRFRPPVHRPWNTRLERHPGRVASSRRKRGGSGERVTAWR
jgi:pimeloyl-ACP methyl ester carboxylesterase